jgi:hypothetical protein
MGEDVRAIRQDIAETRGRMGDTVEALSYKTDVKARAKDAVTDKRDAVVNRITDAREAIIGKAGDVTGAVSDAAPNPEDVKRTARRAASVAQQNPLGLAVGAAALGFLAGMVVPGTRFENEKIGEVADQVKDGIKETAAEALDHGKEVAGDAAQAAMETAKTSGQDHAQQLASTAGARVEETANSVQPGY